MDFPSAQITLVHKDKDALTIMFANGRTLLFTGKDLPAIVPEFVELESVQRNDLN